MTHEQKLAALTVSQCIRVKTNPAFGYAGHEVVDSVKSITKREIVTRKSGRFSLKTGRQVGFIGAPESGDSYIVI